MFDVCVFPNLTGLSDVLLLSSVEKEAAYEYGVDGSAGSGHNCGLITSV